MVASLNKVTLIGNLGKDPELRYTKSQTPFARFSLATTEEFTSNGEKQRKTMWHNLVVWGKQAEIAQRYLHKGKQIFVEGKIEYREYDDANGQRRNITDIRVDRFLMLGQAPGGSSGGQYGGGQSQSYGGGQNQPQSYGAPSGGGNFGNQAPPPQQYGNQNQFDAVPESDSFNDDDIPF